MRRLIVALVLGFVLTLLFQNCGSVTSSKVGFTSRSVQERFGDIDCLTFDDEVSSESCLDKDSGMIGNLYYLLDKTDGSVLPDKLYDKNDNELTFAREHLSSVNVIIDRGYQSNYHVIMPEISVPAIAFSDGFQVSPGQYLKNHEGNILVEAFALDLKGKLVLGNKEPGHYAIGILSDDGSILDMDLDGDGRLEQVIDNDEYHSPRLECSASTFYLDQNSAINMRLRYFQGPRTTIALTVVMKKIDDATSYSRDSLCGEQDGSDFRWYGATSTSAGYIPDYVNSPFGQLISRGWFIPGQEMYQLPDTL